MWSSARSPAPMHVTAAMFTPASLIAAATSASAPGVLSTSMIRSTATVERDLGTPTRSLHGHLDASPRRGSVLHGNRRYTMLLSARRKRPADTRARARQALQRRGRKG